MRVPSKTEQATASQAIRAFSNKPSSAFVCPYPDCGVYALHHWGHVVSLNAPLGQGKFTPRNVSGRPPLLLAQCEACKREVVFAGRALIWPRATTAPAPHPDMPDECLQDYNEAMGICELSPRAAAALLRLSLEKLLPIIGAKKAKIDAMIGELVQAQAIPETLQQALDSVRVIGNGAVHPGEIDLKDDFATVLGLFSLMNFIVEKAIAEPKAIAQMYAGLPPAKLEGIDNRDKRKPALAEDKTNQTSTGD